MSWYTPCYTEEMKWNYLILKWRTEPILWTLKIPSPSFSLLFHPFPQSLTCQYFFLLRNHKIFYIFPTRLHRIKEKIVSQFACPIEYFTCPDSDIYRALFHFSINIYNIHPIAHPSVWGMGCLLGVECLIFVLLMHMAWCMQHRTTLYYVFHKIRYSMI